jgi:hypothetical protein
MKIFPALVAAFLTRSHHSHDQRASSLLATKRELKECFKLRVRRRLIDRFVNNERYDGLAHPHLVPGDQVKQKSVLLNPDNPDEEIGTVYTLATILDDDVRLAHGSHGAYNITRGDRIGVINFSALIPNHLATNAFDMAITSGTGQFHSAGGYILITPPKEVNGFLERDATLYICGLYEDRDAS